MAAIPLRAWRDSVGEVPRRAEAGERIVVTVNDQSVAEPGPVLGSRPAATLRTLRSLGAADDAWLVDQQRVRDESVGELHSGVELACDARLAVVPLVRVSHLR